jgi:hypothetical protein
VLLCVWHVLRAWRNKLWQLLDLRNKGTFQRIIERMEAIMKVEVQATANEAPLEDVNAVMDTVLKAWETSEDTSEQKAAECFKCRRKKTGEALDLLQQSMSCCPGAGLMCARVTC